MWNEKLAARASAMRARFSRMAEVLRLKEERIRQGPISPKEYVERRITPDERRKGMEKSREAAKGHGDANRTAIIEIESGNMQAGKTFRDPSKRSNYPCCPRCSGSRPEGTIRAGLAHGIQRYRCLHCRSTFSGATVVVKLERQDYKMLCYHCGSIRTKRVGKGVSESRTGRM